jgi:hypothetical protein
MRAFFGSFTSFYGVGPASELHYMPGVRASGLDAELRVSRALIYAVSLSYAAQTLTLYQRKGADQRKRSTIIYEIKMSFAKEALTPPSR